MIAMVVLVPEQCAVWSSYLIILHEVGLGVEVWVSGGRSYFRNSTSLLGGDGSCVISRTGISVTLSEISNEAFGHFSLRELNCGYIWLLHVVIPACSVTVVVVTFNAQITEWRGWSLGSPKNSTTECWWWPFHWVQPTVVICNVSVSASTASKVNRRSSHPNLLLWKEVRLSSTELMVISVWHL